MPRADPDDHGGLGRPDRGADHRRRQRAITIPPGTQSGHQFRLRGKGMSVLRSPARGDMYIEAVIETPVNLTKRQQELLRNSSARRRRTKTSPESEGFFAVRELWEDLRD
jgi:molecular chaperone DnaJ